MRPTVKQKTADMATAADIGRALSGILPAETDEDVRSYLVGTVESVFEEESDASVEALSEALSDLLVSYELAPEADAAYEMCCLLHAQLAGSQPPASTTAAATPPATSSTHARPAQRAEAVAETASSFEVPVGNGNRSSRATSRSLAMQCHRHT